MNIRTRFLFRVCLLLVLTAAVACGRKTLPLVPDSPRPEAIKDIKVTTRDTVAFLSWPLPTRNVEGRSMLPSDIQRFRIYRAEMGLDKKAVRYKLYAEIDMANPSPAEVRNGTVFWSDQNLKYGQAYSYRVRALSVRGGVSPMSDEVRIAPLLSLAVPRASPRRPPTAPSNLRGRRQRHERMEAGTTVLSDTISTAELKKADMTICR